MSATMTNWNNIADVSANFSQLLGPANEKFVELGKLFPGATVLDLACGLGHVGRRAAELVGDTGRVAGIDGSEVLVNAAKSLPGPANLKFYTHDAQELKFKESSCDVIYSQLSLHAFTDPAQVARRCRALLRPGGRFVVMVLGERNHNQFLSLAGPAIAPYVERAFDLGTPERLEKFLAGAGLEEPKARTLRAQVTIKDKASWWRALRSVLGIPADVPQPQLPDLSQASLSIVMGLGRAPIDGASETQSLKTLQEVVARARARIRELSPYELDKNLGKNAILVDVREPEEWSQGVAKGALRIPRGELEQRLPAEIAKRTGEVVVYCQDGAIGALAAARLGEMGYSAVWNLAGGYGAWVQDRMPIAKPPFKE